MLQLRSLTQHHNVLYLCSEILCSLHRFGTLFNWGCQVWRWCHCDDGPHYWGTDSQWDVSVLPELPVEAWAPLLRGRGTVCFDKFSLWSAWVLLLFIVCHHFNFPPAGLALVNRWCFFLWKSKTLLGCLVLNHSPLLNTSPVSTAQIQLEKTIKTTWIILKVVSHMYISMMICILDGLLSLLFMSHKCREWEVLLDYLFVQLRFWVLR